jgi:hypothetical protein
MMARKKNLRLTARKVNLADHSSFAARPLPGPAQAITAIARLMIDSP